MRDAYTRTRKDGAAGVDGVKAAACETELECRLANLRDRMLSGSYVALPVRRHYIPKADGSKRPLGIPTLEDKVAQRAILMLMEPIYEADFLSCSYGFRPGRSAHDAQRAVPVASWTKASTGFSMLICQSTSTASTMAISGRFSTCGSRTAS